MRTKEQIVAENKILKAAYGRVFEQLAEILFRHDPIGINYEDNTDEYEPEVRTILPRLRSCYDSDDLVTAAHEEFRKWFGPDIAGGKEQYRALGEEIWRLWNKTRMGSTSVDPQA